ncbi:phosphatase PAP2 family protein [Candidatus Saccharibacteria bacterium]|nr:phosphatase PAP2 family protein [Candidatus Saccharibacteria bacterium]
MKSSGVKRLLGIVGVATSIVVFAKNPSWPTPDKLFVFLFFGFLALGQSWEFVKKFLPFVVAILAYEAFRGLVPTLNTRVEYQWMIDVDRWIGGGELPTSRLQNFLYAGHVQWFDFGLYFMYMLHFVLPFALAILIWKKRPQAYWRYVTNFIVVSFAGFLTFLAMPAAPPWMAARDGYIEPITRISSEVWARLGIVNFPSIYNKISPNPVAAVPSLHAAYATLISLFVFRYFGRKWGMFSLVYPAAIYFGTVYQGEHYLIDELIGGLYAVIVFISSAFIFSRVSKKTRMSQERHEAANKISNSMDLGVSFSLLACRDYGIDWKPALKSTLKLGFKRFRLMSYWNVHEAVEGHYDFKKLDEQIEMIQKVGGRVTLSIGMRQPRWPETHLPDWTKSMNSGDVVEKYLVFHEKVIERYKNNSAIESWQLENEFWLRSFGNNFDYSRKRLNREFFMLRELDPERPIIMSVAHLGSLPLFGPTPDLYATSMYRVIYSAKKGYTMTRISPLQYRIKRALIRFIHRRDFIVHELQTEPWGPKANWEMTTDEQFKSINPEQIGQAVAYARASGITYMDLWGAEWWYWRYITDKDTYTGKTVAKIIDDSVTIA